MASPQLEHGYTRIANEIMEHLVAEDLGGAEFRICLFVLRHIYGWKGRKEASLGVEEIQFGTNLHRVTVIGTLRKLLSRNILKRHAAPSKGIPSVWKFNKNWEEWNKVAKRLPKRGSRLTTQSLEKGSQMTTDKVADPLLEMKQTATESGAKSLNLFGDGPPKTISKAKERNEASKEASPGPPQNGDCRLKPLKAFVEAEYERICGCRMITDKSDWIALDVLLKRTRGDPAFDLARLQAAWTALLASPKAFHQEQGHPLRWWANNINPFMRNKADAKTSRDPIGGPPGSTSEVRTSRGERHYIPRQQ